MDSDAMDESAFSLNEESDAFVPETKPKGAAPKSAAGAKKMTQTKLNSKPTAKKRARDFDLDSEDSDAKASAFSNTPPKKQKKAAAPKKAGGGAPLVEIENDSASPVAAQKTTPKAAPKSKKTATETYQKLTQLEHIIKRPDTYIGSVEKTEQKMWVYNKTTSLMDFRNVSFVPGFYKIFDEILVNAADNKQNHDSMSHMKITINREAGEISVENNGKGIPVVIHETEKIYIPELIFGHLLAGSNFDDNEKRTVGGRNGYGAKLCNVFSNEFTLECQDSEHGKRYKQTWSENMQKVGKAKITSSKSADFVRVTFKPDFERFGMTEGIDDDTESLLLRRVYDMAGTIRKVKVYLNGELIKINNFKSYCNLFAQTIAKERTDEEGAPAKCTVEIDNKCHERWEVGFTVSDGTFQQVSFVNSIATTVGGTHVNYIADQITAGLLKQMDKKKKGHGLKQTHLKNHIFIFINVLIDNPTFNSQTKEQMTLKPSQFGSKCELSPEFLKKIYSSEAITNIMEFAEKKADKMLAKSDGSKRSRVNNAKLVEANLAGTRHGKDCTLILTEGDSAKGLAVSGRALLDPDRIGVFPLRGKLLNVRDASVDQISKNQEIQNIKQFLGLKHKTEYKDASSLRYGHLMIMADQDHDGSHIKGLLINFLQVQFPSLLKIPNFFQEFITPIVKVWQGSDPKKPKRPKSFFTQPEYEEWKEAHKSELSRWESKYFKGLGTSTNADAQVYFAELDNHLKQFDVMKPDEAELFELAFSKKRADDRKTWLGNFKPGTYLDQSTKSITYDDFVNKELILFSMADNMRSIPSVIDGFKPGQRKVLYACFKRNLIKDKKVVELAGYVSEHTAYHHGEASLQQTIIGLAQNFVGSNNVSVLEPSGNFGSRLQGGSDAASPRYIFTRLSPFARKIFTTLDEPVLKHNMDDGDKIEPVNYAPVIPMVLVNGADGIGTGWSTSIPNYHPADIVKNLRRRMGLLEGEGDDGEEKPFETMTPWFRGWKGSPEAAGPDRYKFNGIASRDEKNPNEILITELPIRMWTDDFKARLEKVISGAEGPSWIKDYKEFNDHETVHFEIMVEEKYINKVMEEGLLERFKLARQVATSNLVAFDTNGQIRKYEKVEDILEEYYQYRLALYTDRKAYWLNVYEADWRKLRNQARFIREIIAGDLVVGRKKKEILVQELRERKYEAFPRGKDTKKKVTEDDAEDADKEDKEAADEGSRDYDYLLSMPIWSLTLERVEKLEAAIRAKKAEHDELKAKSEKDLWAADLDAFMVEWDAQAKIDAEIRTDIRRMGRRASKKIGAGRSRKPKGDDEYEPEKKARGKKAAVKVETKSSQRFAEMFSAKPAKPKDEPKDDDAFDDDDDFSALSRSKTAVPARAKPTAASQARSLSTSARPSAEPEGGKPKRAAAAVSASKFMDLGSDSDDDDKMLGDIDDLLKGVPKTSTEPSGRVGLHKMSSTDSGEGSKAKVSGLEVSDDAEEPRRPAAKDSDIDSFLSDDDGDEIVKPVAKKPAAVAGLSEVKKSRGRPAGAKAKPKAEPAKGKAAAKQTTLSPAAKAYAAKKAVKKSALADSDDDEDMPDSPAPAPKPAARGRPGRAAAARRPIVLDDSSMLDDSDPFEVDDDED